jgi:assimilatory nitrate reductase catalytic subunit
VGALFLASEPVAVSRGWASEQLAKPHPGQRARMAGIAGRPGAGSVDRGATICSCFGVGANEIAAAVVGGCRTVDTIGEALHAGTNCGSCRGEIKKVISNHCLEAAE